MKRFVCALAVLAAAGSASSALACGTGVMRFADTFDKLQSDTWGDANKWLSVKAGQMVITESNGGFYTALADTGNEGGRFRNIDFCASMALSDTPDVPSSYGGLIFWGLDPDHFYAFDITLDGYAAVLKYDGKWSTLIDDTPSDAIHQGKGASNELRVVTHSGTATFYINGAIFDQVSEKTSPGTSQVGLIVESPKKGTATFTFDNLAVRDPVFGGN
jgi:hypothetical protein